MSLHREYGTIDDVDIDLHINIGFLDVSQLFSSSAHTSSAFAHYYSNIDILQSNIMYEWEMTLIRLLTLCICMCAWLRRRLRQLGKLSEQSPLFWDCTFLFLSTSTDLVSKDVSVDVGFLRGTLGTCDTHWMWEVSTISATQEGERKEAHVCICLHCVTVLSFLLRAFSRSVPAL